MTDGLSRYFESNDIHIAALIVAGYSKDYSHYLAVSSLGDWLKERGIPALHGIARANMYQASTLVR
jgi:carbamoyl-phosphate synthase/aspartate carbamoyltransferase